MNSSSSHIVVQDREDEPMGKAVLAIVVVAVIAIVGMMLYRSTSGDQFPDDEWFEFEVPDEA